MQFVKDLVADDTDKSSARAINILGAMLGSILLAYDTYTRGSLGFDVFSAYLAYCGGVYGVGKYLDKGASNVADK
jgi:hypothetical protein